MASRGRQSRPCRYWMAGVILLIFGVTLVLIGVFDLAWTVARYYVDCHPVFSKNVTESTAFCSSNHIFTYISSPLWGGAFVIISGAVGVSMPVSSYVSHSQCHSSYVLLLFISLLATVSIVILNALETYYGLGHFWSFIDGRMIAYDAVKMALPFSMALLASLTLKVIVFVLFSIHCCGSGRRSRYSHYSDDNSSYGGDRRDVEAPYRSRDYASRSWRLSREREREPRVGKQWEREREPRVRELWEKEYRYPFSRGYRQWRYNDGRTYGLRRSYYN